MKTNFVRYATLVALVSILSACGGGEPPPAPVVGPYGTVNGGICAVPPGDYYQVVNGNLGNGATLTLRLYQLPNLKVGAYGELAFPSREEFFNPTMPYNAYDYWWQFNPAMSSNYGYGFPTTPQQPQVPPNTPMKWCVSTNGYEGSIDNDPGSQHIEMTLTGSDGIYVFMGSSVGNYHAFISANRIIGDVVISHPAFGRRTATFTY